MKESFASMAFVATALFVGCGSPNGPESSSSLVPNPPQQFEMMGDPQVRLLDPRTDGQGLFSVVIEAADSFAQTGWIPSAIELQTEAGERRELVLEPTFCLELQRNEEDFPHNFDWFSCTELLINVSQTLDEKTIEEIEQLISSELVHAQVFEAIPGGTYRFKVPIGSENHRVAVERLDAWIVKRFGRAAASEMFDNGAFRNTKRPGCVHGGSIVREVPPCPPWAMSGSIPISLDDSGVRGGLRLQSGGWVRASYHEPSGRVRSTTLLIP